MSDIKSYVGNESMESKVKINNLAFLNELEFPLDGAWFGVVDEIEVGFSFIKDICQHNERVEERMGILNLKNNLEQLEGGLVKNTAKPSSLKNLAKSPEEQKNKTSVAPYSEADFKAQIELQNKYLIYLEEILNLDRTISAFVQDSALRTSVEIDKKVSIYYLPPGPANKHMPLDYKPNITTSFNNRSNEAIRKLISQTLMKVRWLNLEALTNNKTMSQIIYSKFLIDVLEKFTIFFSSNIKKIEPGMITDLDALYEGDALSSHMNRFIYFEMKDLITETKKNMDSAKGLEIIGPDYAKKLKNINAFYDSWGLAKIKPIEPFLKIDNELKGLDLNQPNIVKKYIEDNLELLKKAITYTKPKESAGAWEVDEFTAVWVSIGGQLKSIAKSNLENAAIMSESGILRKEKGVEFLLHYYKGQTHEVLHKIDSYWAGQILNSSDEVKQKLAKNYIYSSLIGSIKNKQVDLKLRVSEVPMRILEAMPTTQTACAMALAQELEKMGRAKNPLMVECIHELFSFVSKELGMKNDKLDKHNKDKTYVVTEYAKGLKQFVLSIKKKNLLMDKALAVIEKISLNANISLAGDSTEVAQRKNKI